MPRSLTMHLDSVQDLSSSPLSTASLSSAGAGIDIIDVNRSLLRLLTRKAPQAVKIAVLQAESSVATGTSILLHDNSNEKRIRQLANVQSVCLSHNRISSLLGITQFFRLTSLRIDHNAIRTISSCEPLSLLPQLQKLYLTGNPVAALPHYRAHLLRVTSWPQALMPSPSHCRLKYLDDAAVSREEIVAAKRALEAEAKVLPLVSQRLRLLLFLDGCEKRSAVHRELRLHFQGSTIASSSSHLPAADEGLGMNVENVIRFGGAKPWLSAAAKQRGDDEVRRVCARGREISRQCSRTPLACASKSLLLSASEGKGWETVNQLGGPVSLSSVQTTVNAAIRRHVSSSSSLFPASHPAMGMDDVLRVWEAADMSSTTRRGQPTVSLNMSGLGRPHANAVASHPASRRVVQSPLTQVKRDSPSMMKAEESVVDELLLPLSPSPLAVHLDEDETAVSILKEGLPSVESNGGTSQHSTTVMEETILRSEPIHVPDREMEVEATSDSHTIVHEEEKLACCFSAWRRKAHLLSQLRNATVSRRLTALSGVLSARPACIRQFLRHIDFSPSQETGAEGEVRRVLFFLWRLRWRQCAQRRYVLHITISKWKDAARMQQVLRSVLCKARERKIAYAFTRWSQRVAFKLRSSAPLLSASDLSSPPLQPTSADVGSRHSAALRYETSSEEKSTGPVHPYNILNSVPSPSVSVIKSVGQQRSPAAELSAAHFLATLDRHYDLPLREDEMRARGTREMDVSSRETSSTYESLDEHRSAYQSSLQSHHSSSSSQCTSCEVLRCQVSCITEAYRQEAERAAALQQQLDFYASQPSIDDLLITLAQSQREVEYLRSTVEALKEQRRAYRLSH